ncbi:hypothetical protein M9434_001201 [Picochlorum sp. BPE23]|nr:hypothetical protein M9434_001201 [Picochlorum sp. BPE23]KAI8111945.1 hypothetical protein M9435_004442 [Picochlorum sp. BPE23]|mmetsp:Transcript_11363/g.22669  ORF Transcript_11363/g.22669 Transcript_11363/m.22669 type:complete len:87 (+) Transcript_11363:628-888(+)
MQTVAMIQSARPAVAVRPARKSVCVKASAQAPKAPKQQKAAFATLAAFAAAALLTTATPAQADVKSTVCASNATAKICLKDSAKKN